MTTGRRNFFGALAGAASLVGCNAARAPVTTTSLGVDTWEGVRNQFLLDPSWIHLAGFLFASHPRAVRDAIERHRNGFDQNPAAYLHENEGTADKAVRAAAASYMHVEPGEIALTDSTTMGLGTLYQGFPLRSGQTILTTTHDHFVTHESLRLVSQRTGATVRSVPLYESPAAATVGGMADAIARAMTPETRLVAVTWVHSGTGVKTPIRAIADVVAKANSGRAEGDRAILCVDGVHGFGVEATRVGDLGCDFFVAGCHKWLFGPRGTGVLWGKKEAMASLRPSIPAFAAEVFRPWLEGKGPGPTNASMMTPGGFHSFEHRWALREAFDLHERMGPPRVAARIHELNRQCKEGLATMKRVTLHTPRSEDVSAGIVCFEVSGIPNEDVVKRLEARRIVASTTPYAKSYARLAPGLLNSPAEIDRALAAVRELAS